MRLVYSAEAVGDLVRLRQFIAEKNPEAAGRIGKELVERITQLQQFPEMGRSVSEAPDPRAVRDAVFGRYVVRYAVHGDALAILRIWHHREDRDGN